MVAIGKQICRIAILEGNEDDQSGGGSAGISGYRIIFEPGRRISAAAQLGWAADSGSFWS